MSPWSECVIHAAIANNGLDGFATTIESNLILTFIWESYTRALIGNEHTLCHIHILTEAQGHLKKAAELLSTSLQYTGPSALAPPPQMTRFDNQLMAIQATFNKTPAVIPTPAEYVTAPMTPVPTAVPDQMPSAFVLPPATVLPVPPPRPQLDAQEFLKLLIHSMAENGTNILYVEQLGLPPDAIPTRPIGTQ